MTVSAVTPPPAMPKGFWIALAINAVWINVSEVFRYFVFVMPQMRADFPELADVAPMTLGVFAIWGVWDTILVAAATVIPWFALERFGPTARNAVLAGTGVWLTVFCLLWIGLYNMGLATLTVMAMALPLAWLEMAIAALIVRWSQRRYAGAAV
ncbi:MAG: hypothetical protein AAGF19_03360 [Pseudomonadota bacterium]